MTEKRHDEERNGLEVAVIGMSGKFPGADNLHVFWENLKNKVCSIRFFTKEELLADSFLDPDEINNPNYVGAKGVLDGYNAFDAFFFGYSPIEAETMDPQVRIFHELCWETLEDGACDPSTYPGAIGIFAGATGDRWWEILAEISGRVGLLGYFAANYLIDKDMLATRMAYRLDLKGPAVTIHTACSTALVAVDLAFRGLITGQCDAALAGGVSVTPQTAKAGGSLYKEGMIQSPDGYVRAFDAKAKGVVFSDGGGVVLLKRLDDALSDGDHIYAVIKNSYTNNDGIDKSSFNAPAVSGQADVIRNALFMADVEPESIGYVECHGTGTEMGDPIEIEALKIAFNTDKKQYCPIGSVKTNIGHVDTAAGIANFIKAVLVVHHRLIPPSLNFETPNPKIDFENSPFFVNTKLRQWKNDEYPLRAGVSAFGVGGTNAHVILEEAPPPHPTTPGRPCQLILLSARSAKTLQITTDNFLGFLKDHPEINFADLAFTLKVGRKAFEHRKMFVCRQADEAIAILEREKTEATAEKEASPVVTHMAREEKRPVFMFPGQGSQYVNMARGLYEHEPVFRQETDRCFEILKPLLERDIKEIIYPPQDNKAPGQQEEKDINQTEITQPVIFIIEYALAQLLKSWGIEPFAMVGHSIGEYVAACLAGVFSLEDALQVVVWRGRLMQRMPTGSMLSVSLPEEELIPLIPGEVALAAVNAPAYCVVSGPHQAIADFARQLEQKNIQHRKLHTSHAYHSKMMDPMLKTFAEKVGQVTRHAPQIPFISNLSGQWITAEQACDPEYWVRHLRQGVRFADGVSELLKEKHAIFIEVGPGRTLSTFVRQHTDKKPEHMLVNLVRHPNEEVSDQYYLLTRLGLLWLYGTSLDWQGFYAGEKRLRLRLPTYPFQRQRYWLEGDPLRTIKRGMSGELMIDKNPDITQWFYTPCWVRSLSPPAVKTKGQHWLVLTDDTAPGFVTRLLRALESDLKETDRENENTLKTITLVKRGDLFEKQTPGVYTIRAGEENDYKTLVKELQASGQIPDKMIHLWNLTDPDTGPNPNQVEAIESHLDSSFYSLLFLVRALDEAGIDQAVELTTLSNGMQEVGEEPVLFPWKAAMLGPTMIIPREIPNFSCRCIDILLPPKAQNQQDKTREERLIHQLLKEFHSPSPPNETAVAFRGNYRLKRSFEPVKFSLAQDGTSPRLKPEGVYLITGGLGGIGLVLAQYLAKTLRAKLILTGRSVLPPREEWETWLLEHNSLDPTCEKIHKARELEALGAQVMVFGVDVTDLQGMKSVVEEAVKRFGPVNGVIHAAGLPGGGVIRLKTREIADRVMAPKIKGTLVLDQVLQGMDLDFIVLCSSINSVVPIFGQVDYYAANAFMDAYAFYKRSRDNTFTVSINWDAWQRVGMAVEAAKQQLGEKLNPREEPRPLDHPLLEQVKTTTKTLRPGQQLTTHTFTTYFSIRRHFVLSDHMTQDRNGLMPGVAYLEMARAALEIVEESPIQDYFIEIRGVSFLNPLIVKPGEEKETQIILKTLDKDKGYEFQVRSRIAPGERQWQEHSRGEVVRVPVTGVHPAKTHSFAEIEAQCNLEEVDIRARRNKDKDKDLVVFGPRWDSVENIKLGKNMGLSFQEIAPESAAEIDQYGLYPALLDNATALMFVFIKDKSAYIPYSYKKLKIYAPLPAKVYSFSRLAEDLESSTGYLKFNVSVLDEEGRELVDIEEFTMLEISTEILEKLKEKESDAAVASPPVSPGARDTAHAVTDEGEELVKDGLSPADGVEIFRGILFDALPQMVISTRNLEIRTAGSQAPGDRNLPGEAQLALAEADSHERPDISSHFVPPANEAEEKLIQIWRGLLGIKQVGVLDDFFELGGDSLRANVMISRIKEAFNLSISVREVFNSPRIRDLAKLLGDQDATAPGDVYTYTDMQPVEKREYYPLSPMQRKLYVLNQMEGIGTAYNMHTGFIVEGKTDRQRVERTFRLLLQRHESLRSSIAPVGKEPVQFIHDTEDLDIQVEYSEIAAEIGTDKMNELALKFTKPYDLAASPFMRLGLVKLTEEKHILILDVHHIISDASSFMILIRDYNALYEDEGKNLPGLRLQFKDFAVWQTKELEKASLKKQEEYWLGQFQNMPPTLELFTDFPRPQVQSFAGVKIWFNIDKALTLKIYQLLKETGTTLFMVLLAAYNILLSKFSGQEDIVVGTPIAGREHADLQNVNGVFINTLPMRNQPAPKKTFIEFLKEIKETSLNGYENQGYPFAELIEKLQLTRDISRNPLYDVELIVQSMTISPLQMNGAKTAALSYEAMATQLDLSLEALELTESERIDLYLTYCTALFKKETIDKIVEFYKMIISTVVENKEIKIGDIKIPHSLQKAESKVQQAEEIKFGF